MKVGGYVREKQKVLSRIFSNALNSDKLSHAYLLIGESGTPLMEIGTFLAKSILCDHPDPLACEECITCTRIDEGNYPDLIILDGSESSIKKDEVGQIVENFEKTALEDKGIMVYVINMVENMTIEAINSILKFLEEPKKDTYAILTTQNESKILPTIISRCQSIRLSLSPRQEVIDEAIDLNVDPSDAEILSYFYNDAHLVMQKAETEEYANAKEAFEKQLNSFQEGEGHARYVAEKDVVPLLEDKATTRFFFDMMSLAFQDIVASKGGHSISLRSYGRIINALAMGLPHVETSLLSIMTLRREIEANISVALLLPHLISTITKE